MPTTAPRLLALLSLLQSRRDWPAAVLADRLDVTDRTVRRDVDRLRELGYPISSTRGRDGGYRLDAGTRLPPLLFDDDQAVALTVALRTVAASGADLGEAADRALHTVRQVLPRRLAHRVDAVPVTVVSTPGTTAVDPAVLTSIGASVRAREVLRFGYVRAAAVPAGAARGSAAGDGSGAGTDSGAQTHAAFDDDGPTRRVEPHHLVARSGRWYLVGWDLDRGDWRVFRADRIRPRAPGGARFAPRDLPGGDVAAFIDARFRGAVTPGGGWPCRGTVVLAAEPRDVAAFVTDGTVEEAGAGRSRVTLGSWSWVALAASAARFDAEVLDVEPRELADACAVLADRLARAAGSAGRPGPPT